MKGKEEQDGSEKIKGRVYKAMTTLCTAYTATKTRPGSGSNNDDDDDSDGDDGTKNTHVIELWIT